MEKYQKNRKHMSRVNQIRKKEVKKKKRIQLDKKNMTK